MTFYRDHVYPRIVDVLGDPPPFKHVRRRIVPLAHGTVLEIGVGPGPNFAHYDPGRVSRVYALEPNAGMLRLARPRLPAALEVTFLDVPGEHIPLPDRAADTALSTFTLCTIPGPVEALREVRRVLKPAGTLIFFEHGASPDPRVRRWQRWSEPIPRWLFEGCHVTREIPSLIEAAGFRIDRIEAAYLARFPRAWTYCWWGTARRED
jgi:ubiquinone/menaquinone biosynthesis C-methylase UbiE